MNSSTKPYVLRSVCDKFVTEATGERRRRVRNNSLGRLAPGDGSDSPSPQRGAPSRLEPNASAGAASPYFSAPDGESTQYARHYFVALGHRAQRTVKGARQICDCRRRLAEQIIAPGFIPGFKKRPVRDPDPIRVRFRAWARNRTRMSEEGRLAGRFPRGARDQRHRAEPRTPIGRRRHLRQRHLQLPRLYPLPGDVDERASPVQDGRGGEPHHSA